MGSVALDKGGSVCCGSLFCVYLMGVLCRDPISCSLEYQVAMTEILGICLVEFFFLSVSQALSTNNRNCCKS